MKGYKPCDVTVSTSLLEKELSARKARLERAKSDLHHRFEIYANEQACVASLEKALAKAHGLY